MHNRIYISLAFLTVALNGIMAHRFPPSGIMATPFVLLLTSSLICFGLKQVHVFILALLTYALAALNDIVIKLFAGGTHDGPGQGWIQLTFFIGILIALTLVATVVFRRKDVKIHIKISAIALFTALISGHLLLFSRLGLTHEF